MLVDRDDGRERLLQVFSEETFIEISRRFGFIRNAVDVTRRIKHI